MQILCSALVFTVSYRHLSGSNMSDKDNDEVEETTDFEGMGVRLTFVG